MKWLSGEVLSYFQINRLSLVLSFQSGGQISTEALVEHVSREGDILSCYRVGDVPSNLTIVKLLEKTIVDYNIDKSTLRIDFDNGERLIIKRGANESEVAFVSFPEGHEVIV